MEWRHNLRCGLIQSLLESGRSACHLFYEDFLIDRNRTFPSSALVMRHACVRPGRLSLTVNHARRWQSALVYSLVTGNFSGLRRRRRGIVRRTEATRRIGHRRHRQRTSGHAVRFRCRFEVGRALASLTTSTSLSGFKERQQSAFFASTEALSN